MDIQAAKKRAATDGDWRLLSDFEAHMAGKHRPNWIVNVCDHCEGYQIWPCEARWAWDKVAAALEEAEGGAKMLVIAERDHAERLVALLEEKLWVAEALAERRGEALERMLEAAPQTWDHPKGHQLFEANNLARAALADLTNG